jgi:hypothetical protein
VLVDFQQAFADLVASPDLCNEVRANPGVLRESYRLTDREAGRLAGIVNHPGMACNCTLYRANRLAPLAMNMPGLLKALGPDLRSVLDRFWRRYRNTDVHFYVESYRFGRFVQGELARGRSFSTDVEPALRREMATLAERLEVSHTEIYSPFRHAGRPGSWAPH